MAFVGMPGIGATREIHRRHPEIPIIALSFHEETEMAEEMRQAGATAYLRKGGRPSNFSQPFVACVENRPLERSGLANCDACQSHGKYCMRRPPAVREDWIAGLVKFNPSAHRRTQANEVVVAIWRFPLAYRVSVVRFLMYTRPGRSSRVELLALFPLAKSKLRDTLRPLCEITIEFLIGNRLSVFAFPLF